MDDDMDDEIENTLTDGNEKKGLSLVTCLLYISVLCVIFSIIFFVGVCTFKIISELLHFLKLYEPQ